MFVFEWRCSYCRGGGSPIMEEIIIAATYDFEEKKRIVNICWY